MGCCSSNQVGTVRQASAATSTERYAVGLWPNKRRRVDREYVPERFAVPEGAFNAKLPGEKQVIINSSAFLPTGDIILADSVNKKIKLFSCTFQFLGCMEFPTPVQHVCASPNVPLIYASFPDRIRQVHIDGIRMKRSGFIKTPGICRGVYVNKYDGKAISMNVEEDIGQVNLLTPGGNLQMEIVDDDDGHSIFVCPDQVTVTRDLDLLVVDRGQNCVLCVSPDGEPLFQYKGIRNPTAVVCDEKNYIYVAGAHSIHQLNEKGELVKLFLSKAEIGLIPLSLSYNPDKKLLVATGKGATIKLFKLVDL